MPSLVKNFQTKALDSGFTRQYQAIQSAVNSLVVNENKADFFTTSMYVNETPESYADSSGKFIKKYLKVNKYCGDNNGDCFAQKYYEFKNNDKVEYSPEFKGACASLKNGMSLCLTPQIGNNFISGIIDINGKKGPNIKDKDLRTFTISPKSRIGLNTDTQEVYVASSDLKPDNSTPPTEPSTPSTKTACEIDQYSLDCCKTKTGSITSITDTCCTFSEIQDSVATCKDEGTITVKLTAKTKGVPYSWDIAGNISAPASMDVEKMKVYIKFAYYDKNNGLYIGSESYSSIGDNIQFKLQGKNKNATFYFTNHYSNDIKGAYPVECELTYKGKILDSQKLNNYTSIIFSSWNDVSVCKSFGGSYGN